MAPHCDTMDGPVVRAATRALTERNVNLILPWVHAENISAPASHTRIANNGIAHDRIIVPPASLTSMSEYRFNARAPLRCVKAENKKPALIGREALKNSPGNK